MAACNAFHGTSERNIVDMQVQDLKKATDSANAYSNACQELKAKVAAAREQTASLTQQLSAQTEAHNEHAHSLDEELQAAKATISKFEADLQTSLAKAASAEVSNEELRTTIADREAQLQAIQEQLDTIKQDSVAQKTVYDTLAEEHDQLKAKHDELSLALQAVQNDLLFKLADVEQLTAKLVAETTAKVRIPSGVCLCSTPCLGWTLALCDSFYQVRHVKPASLPSCRMLL